ncbi:MAG: hypothetical protein J3K34DRAFT_250002 [Monoraphidium minutum]|nr:MAG: hypothetical protein J3K34DRAFT_250002 [Monoraphidium minutum]
MPPAWHAARRQHACLACPRDTVYPPSLPPFSSLPSQRPKPRPRAAGPCCAPARSLGCRPLISAARSAPAPSGSSPLHPLPPCTLAAACGAPAAFHEWTRPCRAPSAAQLKGAIRCQKNAARRAAGAPLRLLQSAWASQAINARAPRATRARPHRPPPSRGAKGGGRRAARRRVSPVDL